MKKSRLFTYSFLLVAVLVFAGAATLPKVRAQTLDYYVLFIFKQNGHTITSVDATVSSTFELEVCIDNIPQGWSLIGFWVSIEWDPHSQLEVVRIDQGIAGGMFDTDVRNELGGAVVFQHNIASKSLSLFTVRFHCLAEGTATLTFNAPLSTSIDIKKDNAEEYVQGVTIGRITVTQHAAPPSPPSYVGGELFTANKASVLAPYLIGIFSIVTVAAVLVRKKLT